MAIFSPRPSSAQLARPVSGSASLCKTVPLTVEKAQQVRCPDVTVVLKDCRPALLVDCQGRPFRISECGKVEYLICTPIGNPVVVHYTWRCIDDCCPTEWAPVDAIFGEDGLLGMYAETPDGVERRFDCSTCLFEPIECIPSAPDECVRCVTGAAGDPDAAVDDEPAATLHTRKKLTPDDWTIDVLAELCPPVT